MQFIAEQPVMLRCYIHGQNTFLYKERMAAIPAASDEAIVTSINNPIK